MMKKIILSIIQLICIIGYGYGQQETNKIIYNTLPKVAQQSPQATNLQRYGQIPVSHYTGVPNISIPIYQIALKDFVLPITLDYHASGIKVNDISSWVGLGWNLNAGGCITRTVNDMPDEYTRTIPPLNSTINLRDEDTYNLFKEVAYNDVNSRTCDTQFDDFSYNFPGYNGQFFLKGTYNLEGPTITDTYEGIEIRSLGTSGFEIKASNGCKYTFKEIEKTGFSTSTYGASGGDGFSTNYYNGGYITSTWYLTSIITPNEEEITFKYKRGGALTTTDISYTETVGDIPTYNGQSLVYSIQDQVTGNENTTTMPEQVFLSEIIFPGGRILFDSSKERNDNPNGFRLNKIRIYDLSNNLTKNVDFSYNYFYSNKGSNAFTKESYKYRLKLLDVTIGAEKHQFKYDSFALPVRNSFAVDWFGYYNGADSNNHLIPRLEKKILGLDMGYSNVTRNVSLQHTQACILDTIIYPTGGYSIFEYENHKINQGQSLESIGGLRIMSIKNYDLNNKFIEGKVYNYGKNKDGLGKLNGTFSFDVVMLNQLYVYKPEWTVSEGEVSYILYALYSIPMKCSPYGNLVSYSHVYESSIDKDNNKLGSTIYEYSFINDAPFSLNTAPPYHYSSNRGLRGQLLKQEIYDINNTLKYKKEISYRQMDGDVKYSFYLRSKTPSPSIFEETNPGLRSSRYQWIWIDKKSYFFKPLSEMEVFFDGNDSITTLTRYTYDRPSPIFINPTQKHSKLASGDSLTIVYEYPYGNENELYREMVEDRKYYPLLGEKHLKNSKLFYHGKITYEKLGNLILPTVFEEKYGDPASFSKVKEYKYGNRGKPVFILSNSADRVVYLWSYNYQYPIAEIKGATYDEVKAAISGGETTILSLAGSNSPDMTKVDALRTALPRAQVTTYTYQPLVGMKTMKDPRGVETSYAYDNFFRLQNVTHAGKAISSYLYNYKK